ncbi:hypothetical protein M3J09_011408 [Ascochyta lentis]
MHQKKSENEIESPRNSNNNNKNCNREKSNVKADMSDKATGHPHDVASTQGSKPAIAQRTRQGKEGRISNFWRWDIKEGVSLQYVAVRCKGTNDLFVYHALPIVKRRLGPRAKREELRMKYISSPGCQMNGSRNR